MTEKRILYISHSSGLAGAEVSLELLVTNLSEEKYRPVVVLPGDGPLRAGLQEKTVATREHNCVWWIPAYLAHALHPFDFFGELSENVSLLKQIIREEKIDIVHTNCAPVIEGALAAYQEGIPHVWHIREMLGQPDSGLICILGAEITYKIIAAFSRKIIAVSNAVKADIAQFVDESKIAVVYNGVDTKHFEDAAKGPYNFARVLGKNQFFKVCTLGNISERKGYRTLMEVAEHVVRKNPKIASLAAGELADANLYQYMMEKKENGTFGKNFHFLGFEKNIPSLLNSVDLVVLPSLNDPFPRVVLEAMAAGKPVIVTSAGGGRECVLDNQTGFVVEPGDSEAIANHILELAGNPERASNMGALGKERVKTNFNVPLYVSEIERIYDDILNSEIGIPADKIDLAEQILPVILSISHEFEKAWSERARHVAEWNELERLKAFEKRVQRLPIYNMYHALKKPFMKLLEGK